MQGQWLGGKGDKNRTSDYKKFTSGYDKIFKKSSNKEELKWDVYGSYFENGKRVKVVDLLEDDIIEWKTVADEIEITIVKECFSVGESSCRGGSVFTVSAEKFEDKYKPAFR